MLPLIFCACLLTGLDTTPPPDGPYLFYEEDGVVAQWADLEAGTKGEVVFTETNFDKLPRFRSFRPEYVDLHRTFKPDPQIHFNGVNRVAAISDIHGQFDTGVKLLSSHGIIDAQNNWAFGNGHLVIVGDIFDRGDQVTEMLWLVHDLQIQAREAGGRLHFLLGNHETMIMEGDDRYLNKKYRKTMGLTGKFYRELYGKDTYLGRWLRSMPISISINGNVYVHGGLGRHMVKELSNIAKINEVYREYIMDVDDLSETLSESHRLSMLHGREGPLWYRGYFVDNEFDERDLNFILRKIKADRIIVGHTSFTAIKSYFEGKLIAVDSSIKFGSIGEVLLIEDGTYYRGKITGERLVLGSSSTK